MSECKWISKEYYVVPQHDVEDFYWRIPLQFLTEVKYCPYCGKQIMIIKK